jgi:hypothetical protein
MKNIFGNSTDPTEIKIIPIHLWSLKEEVRHALMHRKKQCKELGIEENFDDIFSEYKGQIPNNYINQSTNNESTVSVNSNITQTTNNVADANQLDDSEDAMAAALAGGGDEVRDAGALDDSEDAMAAALAGGDDEVKDAGALDDSEDAMAAALTGGDDEVKDAGALDDSEDAMAALLGGGDDVQDASALDDSEDAMAALLGGGDSEPSSLSQNTSVNTSIGSSLSQIIPPTRSLRKIIPDEKVSGGILLLSDINMDQIRFFCDKEFIIGQTVMVEFILHEPLILSAEIIHVNRFNLSSRIIRETSAGLQSKFRIIANFKFIKKGERHFLRDLLASIEPEKVQAKVKKQKNADEDLDDDLGLGDFF